MIVVGTTLTTFAMSDGDAWRGWLLNAEALREQTDDEVWFFAAIEIDARGLEPFAPLVERLTELGGEYWTYHLDDGRTAVDLTNRLRHITVGQNLVTDYAVSTCAEWLLFMAADCAYPPDALNKMRELNHPLVGGHVPTYGLDGPTVPKYIPTHRTDVREHMATAAFVLLHRDLFRYLRWRWDLDAGMSDDPCLHYDASTFHETPTYVHHGVVGRHYPECIGDYESRGYDTKVVR